MSSPKALLLDQFYHIFIHGIEPLSLFRQQRDYYRFLRLYVKHIEPIADTFAFCLLPNHAHFLIHTKAPHEQALSSRSRTPRQPSQHFSNLLNAYARYYNLKYRRSGPLFQRPFGRKEIDSVGYFKILVVYIHRNAQHHGLVDDFRDWPYTSYHLFFTEKPTRLKRETVLGWFSDLDSFVVGHTTPVDFSDIAEFTFDD